MSKDALRFLSFEAPLEVPFLLLVCPGSVKKTWRAASRTGNADGTTFLFKRQLHCL